MFPLPSIHNGLIYLRLNLFYDQHSFRYFQHTALIIAGKCRHFRSFSSLYHWTGFRLVSVFRFQLMLAATSQKSLQLHPKDLGWTGSWLGCVISQISSNLLLLFVDWTQNDVHADLKLHPHCCSKYRKTPDCKKIWTGYVRSDRICWKSLVRIFSYYSNWKNYTFIVWRTILKWSYNICNKFKDNGNISIITNIETLIMFFGSM